jgi:hypothetical protein
MQYKLEIEMKSLKYLLTFALALSFLAVNGLHAADEQDNSRFDEELNERDFDALRDYLRSKRALDIEESTSTLTISGDVRTEWRHMNETCRGMRLRGRDAKKNGLPISRNDFDLEFNLRFDYICEKAWASSHVRFDCSGGVDDNGHSCNPCNKILAAKEDCVTEATDCFGDCEGFHGSGNCVGLCLKKAYFGYELYSCGDARFFFELGRRGNLYNVFDSNIQFLSRFDGLLFKYENSWECVADWYVTAASFLIDERVNHFGWAAEIGFLNIGDSGLDFKYSLVDWEKHGKNRCGKRSPRGFRFINSQFTTVYNLNPEWMGRSVKLYSAILANHAAKDLKVERYALDANGKIIVDNDGVKQINETNYGLQNIGWYAGILIGKVRKEGDWALEIQYQYVEAQAIPDGDVSGIGRGNVLDESFTTCALRGNTNFKGWRVQGLYAFTDNLSLDTILEWSQAINDRIGGAHTYSKFEMEAIYAF